MSRIISYQYDNDIQDGDAWIGSEASTGQTKQYTALAVADYLNINGKISLADQMTYRYVSTPGGKLGTMASPGNVGDTLFSSINNITISEQDLFPQNVVAFLQYLVNSDIIISKKGAISEFGHYKVSSYTANAGYAGFYDLVITYIGGSGSIRVGETYNVSNFVLASEGYTNFVFEQVAPAVVWTIAHNLGRFPSVSAVNNNDIGGYGSIEYIDNNNLTVTFSGGFSGKAYIN